MLRIILISFAILVNASPGSDEIISSVGFKFGITKSRLKASYSDVISGYPRYNFPRLGPTFGIFYRRPLAGIPMEVALSYQQEGGLDRLYVTTESQPEGTGEYSIFPLYYDIVDLSLTTRPCLHIGNSSISLIAGGGTSFVLGANGPFALSENYVKNVFSYSYGIGIDLNKRALWLPSVEVLLRNEINNIYEQDFELAFIHPESPRSYKYEQKIRSLVVQLVFDFM